MNLSNQSHLFQLPEGKHYLNCAYMSPLLRSAEAAGIQGIQKKRYPAVFRPEDFFNEPAAVRSLFSQLIHATSDAVALIPSASYGLSAAVQNLPVNTGTHCLTVAEEFPSGYYSLHTWCKQHQKDFRVIDAPEGAVRGRGWTERILEAISKDTIALLMSSVHWTDGTRFDLEAIGRRCRETGTWFIVDGTQSVGAVPIDVQACQIDALVCAAYKWLLGPYASGLAYYGPRYSDGNPIEQSWMNRSNALNFSSLIEYTDSYSTGSGRYNTGEFGNFVLVPMLQEALQQLRDWTPEAISSYCRELTAPLIHAIEQKGWAVEEAEFRSPHITGIRLPAHVSKDATLETIRSRNISVSLRGSSIRISPHLYNTPSDIDALIDCLK